MKIELKRGIRNKFFLIMLFLNVLSVFLGYVLLVVLDEVTKVTFQNFVESVYTVYTQLGIFIFSPIIIKQIYTDYKEKNIMFYKALNYNTSRYYISKVFMVIMGTIMGSIIATLLICVPFGKFNLFFIVFLKIEAVMIFYSILMTFLGFIFSNFIVAFCVSIAAWIIGMQISAISKNLRFFAYYDAINLDYQEFIKFLKNKLAFQSIFINIGENYLFNIIILIICIALVNILKRKWISNGV
ncbi:ABC transporter permease [Defluviitalea phaphyphila]|uniref:ABC transporter permease n=1 Tax=Defluviitalea phaphyphila TaxID=1473580 RepID=UPI000730039B|nr:ABC transporter permease [Defluviitalea phaphyphila]